MRAIMNNERGRLEALRRYDTLGTSLHGPFEAIIQLASELFDTPVVLISLIEEDKQSFRACCGLHIQEISRQSSLCAQVILGTEVVVVSDATLDARFANHPFVLGKPHMRFYAGAPLCTPDGHAVGTLCLIDKKPRSDFGEEQRARLQMLADLVVDEFELRVKSRDLEQALATQSYTETRLRESEQELQTILASTSDIIASFDPSLRFGYINPPVNHYGGLPAQTFRGKTSEELGIPLHLADLWNEKLREVLKTRRYGELEFDVMTDHGPLYFQTKIVPRLHPNGEVEQMITVTRDVTSMKQAQQELESFFDLSQDLLVIVGLDGKMKRINATWQTALGYNLEELLQLSPHEIIHPEDVANGMVVLEQLKEGKPVKTFEQRLKHKNGDYRWLQWKAQVLVHQGLIFGIARDVTEEKLVSLALSESEARFHTLFYTASLGIVLVDEAGVIQQTNAATHRLFSYDETDLYLQTITDIIPDFPLEALSANYNLNYHKANNYAANNHATNNHRLSQPLELQGRRKDGSTFPLEVNLNSFAVNVNYMVVLFVADTTVRKQQECLDACRANILELVAERAPLAETLDYLVRSLETNYPSLKAAIHVKRGQQLVLFNAASLLEFVSGLGALSLEVPTTTPSLAATSKQLASSDDVSTDAAWLNYQMLAKAFKVRSCWSRPIINDEGNVCGTLSLFSSSARQANPDELKLLGEAAQLAAIAMSQCNLLSQLEHQSLYEPVTGLGNRKLMGERLEYHLALCEQQDEALAVVLLDIDHFKAVNDVYGHAVGDRLLKAVASRLKSCLRPTDTVTRLGEDEFGLILPLARDEDSRLVVKKIMDVMGQPFDLSEHSFDITVSVGVSLYPDNGQSTDVLMKFANSALSVVKDEGKKTYRYYHPSMLEHLNEQLELSRDLKRAFVGTGLLLYYQPRVHPETRETLAAETLIRWQHPTRGFLPPAAFLGVAEKANLMADLDTWVLRETCRQLRVWQDQTFPHRLSCNLSAESFKEETFTNTVIEVLRLEGIDPKRLELEITENMLLQHPDKAAAQLTKLKEALPGLSIAIDDFGTGHSSLAYLRYLPVDTLKIDRLFVRDLDHIDDHHRQTARAVISTIILLGQQLELNVVAEGVETETQIEFLIGLGCKEIQGYAFSRPLPLEAFTEFIFREKEAVYD